MFDALEDHVKKVAMMAQAARAQVQAGPDAQPQVPPAMRTRAYWLAVVSCSPSIPPMPFQYDCAKQEHVPPTPEQWAGHVGRYADALMREATEQSR